MTMEGFDCDVSPLCGEPRLLHLLLSLDGGGNDRGAMHGGKVYICNGGGSPLQSYSLAPSPLPHFHFLQSPLYFFNSTLSLSPPPLSLCLEKVVVGS